MGHAIPAPRSHEVSASPPGRRGSLVDRWLGYGVVLAVVGLVPGVIGWDHWIAELLIHWHLWISGSLALACPLLLWRGRRRFATMAALGVLHGLWVAGPYLPLATPAVPPPDGEDARRVVVASVNLLQDFGDYEAALDWVVSRSPDVVVVQELTPDNAFPVRDRLLTVLSHQHCAPAAGSFGIGIASRWPIKVEALRGTRPTTQFVVTVEAPGGAFVLVAVHVWPPVREIWSTTQRATLDRIAARVENADLPIVVAGDFNLTPWSPTFIDFLDRTDLRDPRVGRGVRSTWSPAGWPVPGLIPIDHILVSSHWKASEVGVGPAFGSDHRPYVATLWRK